MQTSKSTLVRRAAAAAHLTRRGLTLVEIMVVIAILGLLMSVIAFNVVASADEADVEACKLQIGQIERNLALYETSSGSYPTTAEGLEAAARYFVNEQVPQDPWGNDYQYTSDGTTYEIVSLGKGGEPGGEEAQTDISSNDDVESAE